MSKTLMNELIRIAGKDNVSNDEAERFAYAFDFSVHKCMPDVVVMPKNTREVSRVLKLANKISIPVIPRGGGTGTAGGALAPHGGIVLDISGMDKIKDIDKDNLSMTCEGGATIDLINKTLQKEGCFFPMQMDGLAGIIGGYIACNGTGEHAVKFGKMRDWVRALEVVLPDGEILRCGSKAPVSANPELSHLFVGTEGVLGIITEAVFGILPLPEKKIVGIVSVDSLEKAGRIMSEILKKGLIADLMVYDSLSIKGMRARLADPKASALLKITLIGNKEEIDRHRKDILEIIHSFGVIKTEWLDVEKTPVQTNPLIDMASICPGARPVHIAEDIAVPVSRLSEALTGIKAISRKHKTPVLVISGDVGRGILHPALLINVEQEKNFKNAEKVVEAIYKLTIALGGTISGTHGIGMSRGRYMRLENTKSYMKTFAALKRALDPRNILNPGKMGLSPVPAPFAGIVFRKWWNLPGPAGRADEHLKELITCDFCGFCNTVCPVFLKKKRQSLSPRGRLLLARGLLTGEIKPSPVLKKSFAVCTDCGLCDKACPKAIRISDIIKVYRKRLVPEQTGV